MRAQNASRGQGGRRRATRSAGSGAHAAGHRRARLVPLAAILGILLAILTWQALEMLVSDGKPVPVSSATNPAGASGVGTLTQVSIGDDGGLHVVVTLTFAAAQKRIDLVVPRRGGPGAGLSPTLGSLMINEPSPVREAGPLGAGDQTTIRLASPSRRVVLEYDATGVVKHSGDASSPDRALALVTPLVVLGTGNMPSTVEVRSVKVLNVGCLHRSVLEGCGTRTRDGWTIESSGDEGAPDVFAQLNLAVP